MKTSIAIVDYGMGNLRSVAQALKKAAPLEGHADRTYQQFTTERPTFANDDLLSELTAGGATVRATPIVQHRGFLTNLLISIGPILLIVALYAFMFRRRPSCSRTCIVRDLPHLETVGMSPFRGLDSGR